MTNVEVVCTLFNNKITKEYVMSDQTIRRGANILMIGGASAMSLCNNKYIVGLGAGALFLGLSVQMLPNIKQAARSLGITKK